MIFIKPYHGLIVFLLFLSACSNQATRPTDLLLQQSDKPIPKQWTITAKLGIRTADDSGSVTLQWKQTQSRYHIHVSGPLGQGNALLSGDDSHMIIKRPNKQTIYSNEPEQLIKDTFGWELPLKHLRYWVRGLTSPYITTDTMTHKTPKILSRLQQNGWSLDYQRYQQHELWLMPQKIRAEKTGTVLTLIIKQWEFPPSTTLDKS